MNDKLHERYEWLKKHVSYRAPEAIGLDEFNHAIGLVDGYREQLRRAQLLTPDAVKAVCEREGGESCTGKYGDEFWCWDKFQCCEDDDEGHGWVLLDYTVCTDDENGGEPDPQPVSSNLLAIGQLEDAIKQAKETNA